MLYGIYVIWYLIYSTWDTNIAILQTMVSGFALTLGLRTSMMASYVYAAFGASLRVSGLLVGSLSYGHGNRKRYCDCYCYLYRSWLLLLFLLLLLLLTTVIVTVTITAIVIARVVS